MSSFKKPNLRPKRNVGRKDTKVMTEYNGWAAGKHTVALGVCSIPNVKGYFTDAPGNMKIDSPWYLMGLMIIRKILKKHYGVTVESHSQLIDFLVPPVFQTQGTLVSTIPKLVKIVFYRWVEAESVTPAINSAFEVVMPTTADADRTIGTIAMNIGNSIQNWFGRVYAESVAGTGTHDLTNRNRFDLYGYQLEEFISLSGPDSTPALTDASNRVMSSIYRMDKWIVNLKYVTQIRIQNVSIAGSGGQTNADTYSKDSMESNDLVGKIYHFTDPYPVPNARILSVTHPGANVPTGGPTVLNTNMDLFHYDKDHNGIIKNDSITDQVLLRQVPFPTDFKNCSRYSNAYLKAGENKSMVQVFKFNGYLSKLIEGLSSTLVFNGGTGEAATNGDFRQTKFSPFGTHDLFVFEDYNGGHGHATANDPNIGISYQVKRFGSMKFIKEVNTGMQPIRDYTITPVYAVAADS